MTRETSAWMPLYVGDYLGDTQRLTTEQHGAYLLLILDYWRNGPAPDDDAVLQQITKLDRSGWRRHRPALARMFQVEGGEWRHKRIDRELESAATNSERRSSKAKAAAQARWGTQQASNPDAQGNAPSMPGANLGGCPPQSPSPEEKSSDADASGAAAPKALSPLDLKAGVFGVGKPFLMASGLTAEKAGTMLGKWRREHGDGAVIDALAAAHAEAASNPIPFIIATLGTRNGKRLSRHDVDDASDPGAGRTVSAARHAIAGLGSS